MNVFDRLLAMTYGTVGKWCGHLKKDWEAGKRLVPISECLLALVIVFTIVVNVWKGVVSLLSQSEVIAPPQVQQSNLVIGNTGSVNQTLTINGKLEPMIWYSIASSSVQQRDGLYLTNLHVYYGFDPSLDIDKFYPVLSDKFIKCWQPDIGEIIQNNYGLNGFKGRSSIETYLLCTSQKPIEDDGSLVGL